MFLYDLIFNFIRGSLFSTDTNLGDIVYSFGDDAASITFDDWISHTLTIIVLILFCIALVKLAIWIFKLGANLIRLR